MQCESVMSSCNKRVGGAGRSKLGGTSFSRLKFPCQVPSCDGSLRSDLHKSHYLSLVLFDDDGLPVNPNSEKFSKLNEKKQKHTKFFYENNFTDTKLPTVKKPTHAAVFNNFFKPKPKEDIESTEPPSKKPKIFEDEPDTMAIGEREDGSPEHQRSRSPPANYRQPDPMKDDPSVIKIRGLPYQTTAMEVCRFFKDCEIVGGSNGIYFPLNETGLPTGEAFVEMETAMDIDKALERHNDYIGERWVIIVMLGMEL